MKSEDANILTKKSQRDFAFKEIEIAVSNGLESCLIDKSNRELINELKSLGYLILLESGYYGGNWYRCVWGEEALKIKNRSFFDKIFFSTYKII